MLGVARYKIGMIGQGCMFEAWSVHSRVGLKQVGSDGVTDLESCSPSPSPFFPPLPLPQLG